MNILDYTTSGGKNLIMEYINSQPIKDRTLLLETRKYIRDKGMAAFSILNVRHLRGKLYEIKVEQTDMDTVYFLHICKKQKGKAEKVDIDKAIARAKNEGLM